MKKLICAGNWKLNKSPKEAAAFVSELLEKVGREDIPNFLVFPPAVCLQAVSDSVVDAGLQWGAQNIFQENSGAYTGETSAEVVAHMDATHALVGHSERRAIFSESDDDVAAKVACIQQNGMVPVVCVGESLGERESGETNQVISKQLSRGLSKADGTKDIIVAYEPVWAIGTGKVATPEQAEEAHQVLRKVLVEVYGEEMANQVSILYGGSVKPGNAAELASKKNIDGFLIGGASLEVDSFVAIGNCLFN